MNKGNYQTTPVGSSLTRIAREAAANEIMKRGRALPAVVKSVSGSIVTVTFQVSGTQTYHDLKMPTAGWEYFRPSIKPGDRGYCIPSDYYLGGVSGLGGGAATEVPRGNLSNLAFHPVGNTDFQAEDASLSTIYGNEGAILKDKAGTAIIKVTTGQIQFIVGDTIVTITGTGITTTTAEIVDNAPIIELNGAVTQGTGTLGGDMTMQGPLTVNTDISVGDVTSVVVHTHSGVTTGGGVSGPPVPGT